MTLLNAFVSEGGHEAIELAFTTKIRQRIRNRFAIPDEMQCDACLMKHYVPIALQQQSSVFHDEQADLSYHFSTARAVVVAKRLRLPLIRVPDYAVDIFTQPQYLAPGHVNHIPASIYGMPGIIGRWQVANGQLQDFLMDGHHRFKWQYDHGQPCYAVKLDLEQTSWCLATGEDQIAVMANLFEYDLIPNPLEALEGDDDEQ